MELNGKVVPGIEDRIATDPRILGGKPVVKGTRIPVELVLEQLAFIPDLDELFAVYPRLTRDDVRACLAYARAAVAARTRRPRREPVAATSHARGS